MVSSCLISSCGFKGIHHFISLNNVSLDCIDQVVRDFEPSVLSTYYCLFDFSVCDRIALHSLIGLVVDFDLSFFHQLILDCLIVFFRLKDSETVH